METIEKTLTEIKIINTKEEIYLIADLEKELSDIEKLIEQTEKEPNEILMPNDSKFFQIEKLNERKKELIKLLEIK